MTTAEITLAAFTVSNSLRVLAYIPQISRALADRSGAEAISLTTWTLFLVSHASAVAYAVVNLGNMPLAAMFFANAMSCCAIIGIAIVKRRRYSREPRGRGSA